MNAPDQFIDWDAMAWAAPKHPKETVNKAGKMLVRSLNENFEKWPSDVWNEYGAAIDIINNWRGDRQCPRTC